MKKLIKITCRTCNGKGGWTEIIDPEIGGPYFDCQACETKGTISIRRWWSLWFWDHAPVWYMELVSIFYYSWDKFISKKSEN